MNVIKRLLNKRETVGLDAAANLFGTLAKQIIQISPNAQFIPAGVNGETIDLTGVNVSPQWMGLSSKPMQYAAYMLCSPLASVIDKLAEADTNGRMEFLNDDDTIVKNINNVPKLKKIKRLFENPNPLETWYENNSSLVVFSKIFGYCPQWHIRPSGYPKEDAKFIFNLNPLFCTPIKNDNYNPFSPDSNPIKEWKINVFGYIATIPASEIVVVRDSYISTKWDTFGLPMSKIEGLDFFVSNICASMEADNVLLKKKGPLGVFSHETKPDPAGYTPMMPDAKDELQSDLARYGLTLGQLQYVISKTPVKWNPMSFNARDLMTKETVRQGIDGICDRFGYPPELMSGKNATYENRSSAEKYLYQNNIIPFSLRRMATYRKWYELEDYKIRLDYNHLPVLQEDLMSAGQARKATSESLTIDWKNGMIDYNEYRVLQELDELPGMKGVFYPDYIKLHPELNVDNKPKKDKNGAAPKDTGATK